MQCFALLLSIAGTALSHGSGFEFKFEKHACAVCSEMMHGMPCERFKACDHLDAQSFRGKCELHCPTVTAAPAPPAPPLKPDFRVTKGFGSKPYDQVRVSVITGNETAPVPGFYDYSGQFKNRWTEKYLHTAMKTAIPGQKTTFEVGAVDTNFTVSLPKQGQGVAGVLIADPCMGAGGSITSLIGCTFGKFFQTYNRTVELINTFVADPSTDFWGIFGDNFYDRTGEITTDVFSRISLDAKAKLFMTVSGNHDYWILGDPYLASSRDQCGNGHMQFYAQDSKASEFSLAGNSTAPFDFSVNPDREHWWEEGCNLAAMSNFFWYNQVGNVGIVGQSGAYAYEDVQPFMQESCTWLSKQTGLDVAVLIGHWDFGELGAVNEMSMPQWYTEMASLPGCKEFDERGMLKFVMGHTHCNTPHPHGQVGAGFRVAGFGMEGCGNYGMPLVDTTDDRVRFWYFDTSSDAKFSETVDCVKATGWRQCTRLATLWLDQAINKSSSQVVV